MAPLASEISNPDYPIQRKEGTVQIVDRRAKEAAEEADED